MSNLLNESQPDRRSTYSAIVSGGTVVGRGNMSTVQRKILANKNNRLGSTDDDFKVSKNKTSSLVDSERYSKRLCKQSMDRAATV